MYAPRRPSLETKMVTGTKLDAAGSSNFFSILIILSFSFRVEDKVLPAPTLRSRHGFRNSFISLTGMLFTFPSRYSFTIDLRRYLALEVSAPRFRQGFSGPALLEDICIRLFCFSHTGLSPSMVGLSRTVPLNKKIRTPFNRVHIPRNPGHPKAPGLGSSAFARHY